MKRERIRIECSVWMTLEPPVSNPIIYFLTPLSQILFPFIPLTPYGANLYGNHYSSLIIMMSVSSFMLLFLPFYKSYQIIIMITILKVEEEY